MISSEIVIAEGRPEHSRGKNKARRVRASGKIPAVIYGAGKGPEAVAVDPKQITKILHSETGHNTIFDVELGSGKEKAMVVDWQYDPTRGNLLHIDMKRIALDKKLRVKVPITLTGVAEGVRTQGGILDQIVREVELECLPADIPAHIEVDVTNLTFGQVLRVSDLPHGGKLRFVTSESQPVAHVTSVKEEVVEAAAPVEAVPGAAAAEPEVIKKGKQETDEAAPAAKK